LHQKLLFFARKLFNGGIAPLSKPPQSGVAAFLLFLITFSFLLSPLKVLAHPYTGYVYMPLNASSAILIEQSTGRVLYAQNPHEPVYPAGLTTLLTALVVLDFLDPDEVLIVGQEIRNMPTGFATNVHIENETITVRMLLKAMLIRGGNESARVLALNVVREYDGRMNIPYMEAKQIFSRLMNRRAVELGAINTNFNNPYGLHSEQHHTTAYDMALIAQAFLQVPLLAEIVAIRTFEGDSLGDVWHHAPNVRNYNWTNGNQMLPDAPHGHPYITGLKVGFTNAAGHNFASSAYHNGLGLIAMVFDSGDTGRWQDSRRLIDWAFHNFAFRDVTGANETVSNVYIYNPRRGDSAILDVIASQPHNVLLSNREYAYIERKIEYIFPMENDEGIVMLQAPIADSQIIGTAFYLVDGMVIFEAPVVAGREVLLRTFDSDMDYQIALIRETIFTRRGLPYWFGVIGTLFGIMGVCFAISANRRAKRGRWG